MKVARSEINQAAPCTIALCAKPASSTVLNYFNKKKKKSCRSDTK